MKWKPEEHQKFINFFPKNMKNIPKKMLDCLGRGDILKISFLEIGIDRDHVHFLIQSIPKYSVTEIIRMIKSKTAKKIFEKHPEVKNQLWGGEFWSDGYYIATVGEKGNWSKVENYIQKKVNRRKI